MALKKATRLPSGFNRPTSLLSRTLARKYSGGDFRRNRRKREKQMRVMKRARAVWHAIASEFRVILLISITTVILVTGAVLLFSPFFDVREIKIRRQDPRIDVEQIQDALRPLFQQRLLLVGRSQVTTMLKEAYPDIERVEITKDYPSTLQVTIYLEPIVASVVVDSDETATQSGATLATASGAHAYITKSGIFVASPIAIKSSAPIEPLLFTDWGTLPEPGTQIVDPEFLQTIFSARDILRTDFGQPTQSITVFLRAREFHIRTNRVTFWFDRTSALSVQFERFRELLKNVPLEQIKEYVDLRIADKVVYK